MLLDWEKNLRGNYFLDFSNCSPICRIRFRDNKQHPRMLLSIIYCTSYCFTMFDYKLYNDHFSSPLFSRQVCVKIPVILSMSIKFVNVAQTTHKFLCFIDKNKKDKYGIRRLHSMDIKCIERSNRVDIFCKNVSLKISQNSQQKPVSETLLNKVAGLGPSISLRISRNS